MVLAKCAHKKRQREKCTTHFEHIRPLFMSFRHLWWAQSFLVICMSGRNDALCSRANDHQKSPTTKAISQQKKKSNLKFSSCNSSARGELLAISWRSETEESKEFQKPFNKSFALRWGQTNERFCSHELDRSFLLIAKKRIVFDCVKLKLLKYPKLDNWIN